MLSGPGPPTTDISAIFQQTALNPARASDIFPVGVNRLVASS